MRQFIGMGTGRCGTKSLAEICKAAGMPVYHEHEGYPGEGQGGSYVKHLRSLVREGKSVVGFPLLWLYHLLPRLPVVCLHRDKASFIESANAYFGPASNKVALPFLGENTKDRGDDYYANYWDWAEGVMSCVKQPVLHLRMEELSGDLRGLKEFLGWSEVPSCKREWNCR